MGEPVKIRYLAEQMIRLSGKSPDVDIKIVYTGLRPGEKLHEELFYDEEQHADTGHSKIMLARPRDIDWSRLDRSIDALYQACHLYDEAQIAKLIKDVVPELHHPQVAPGNIIPFKQAQA